MAPKTYRESTSESESKPQSNSRASNKARNAVAQQAQQEYLSKHINSNGPQDKPRLDPLDFSAFDTETLDKYNRRYGLYAYDCITVNGDVLNSEIGKKTHSYKNGNVKNKISKLDMSSSAKKHFMSLPCRENEIITNFLYKVKNEDKEFKLSFK